MNTLRAATLSAVLLLWFTTRLTAQANATGTFSGQVTDPTGAPVANAKVKVTQQETGVSVTKTTATDGNYTVPLLKAGTYTLEVTAPGFQVRDQTRTSRSKSSRWRSKISSFKSATFSSRSRLRGSAPLAEHGSNRSRQRDFRTIHSAASSKWTQFLATRSSGARHESRSRGRHSHAGQWQRNAARRSRDRGRRLARQL